MFLEESVKTTYRTGENITVHISDKSLVSRIYQALLQLNKKDSPI